MTTLSQQFTHANESLRDGWVSVASTWTYASASTITVPAGAASIYQKGDRIRWKQGGAYKYGVLVTVADTLLTIAVNNDYTVANSAITDNYYSHQANPLGYPGWFAYTPTLSANASMTYTSTNILVSRYSIISNICTVQIAFSGTVGGTPSYILRFTLPVAATQRYGLNSGGIMFDNGTTFSGGISNLNTASTTVVDCYKYNASNWTAGTSYINTSLSYEI